jgi:hypothetical protein
MANLLFILGRGRSGTTLLSKILNAHSDIAVAPEGFFAYSLKGKYQNARWNESTIKAFLKNLKLENRIKTWNLDFDRLEIALNQITNPTYQKICSAVYEQYARGIGKADPQWVVDKNPHYALFPGPILQAFPESRALFICRDYRDNILSYQQVPFDTSQTHSLAYRWYYSNKQLLASSEKHAARGKWISYEGLTADTEAEIKDICDFLGVPFQDHMMAFYESEDPNFYGQSYSWFLETKNPVHTGHQNKWEQKMSSHDKSVADAICQPFAGKLGYKPSEAHHKNFRIQLQVVKGIVSGYIRVLAEKLLFTFCPLNLRTFVINQYRSATGRT